MPSRERAVIYSLLFLALALNLAVLLGKSEPQAHASPSHPLLAGDLGPADALILTGDKGDLTVKNDNGRLAWSDNEHSRVLSYAFCHISDMMRQMLESGTFADEKQRIEETLKAEADAIERRGEELEKQYEDVGPDSPNAREAMEAYSKYMDERRNFQISARQRQSELAARQIESVYRDIVAAIDIVADRKNIDVVLRFIPTSRAFTAQSGEGAMEEIRLRTALKSPDALDITQDVAEELGLKVD